MLEYFTNKLVKLFLNIGSMEGEDRILREVLPPKGTYLDIGCSTPIKSSNTFLLYLMGWSGTCIDIREIRRFKYIRPRDKFIRDTVIDISGYRDYDLLDLDVDGIELEILKTMTFEPEFILCENNLPMQKPVDKYLFKLGYKKIAQTIRNGVFRK